MAIQVSRPPDAREAVREPVLVTTALRFGVVGVAGVAVNMIALEVFYAMAHLPLLVASPLAVELAIAHNYLLNDRWTFRARGASLARFAKFNASTLVTLLVNVGVVWVLVSSAGVDYLAANLVGIAVGAALNFGASATWVWHGAGT